MRDSSILYRGILRLTIRLRINEVYSTSPLSNILHHSEAFVFIFYHDRSVSCLVLVYIFDTRINCPGQFASKQRQIALECWPVVFVFLPKSRIKVLVEQNVCMIPGAYFLATIISELDAQILRSYCFGQVHNTIHFTTKHFRKKYK